MNKCSYISAAFIASLALSKTSIAYAPIIEYNFSSHSNKRNISEFSLLSPIASSANNALLLNDIRLSGDNKSNYEGNLGFIYRRKLGGSCVFGIYNYFDRRRTHNKLFVNQYTVGLELFSDDFETRLNIYIPENKRKKIKPSKTSYVAKNNQIYGLKKDKIYQRALPGYDFEFGGSMFFGSTKLREKLDTKLFLSYYRFAKKNIKSITGYRVRFHQPITNNFLNRNITFSLGAGLNFRRHHKKINKFVSLSFSIPFGDASFAGSQDRLMLSRVVRDEDIVTEDYNSAEKLRPLYSDSDNMPVRNLESFDQSKLLHKLNNHEIPIYEDKQKKIFIVSGNDVHKNTGALPSKTIRLEGLVEDSLSRSLESKKSISKNLIASKNSVENSANFLSFEPIIVKNSYKLSNKISLTDGSNHDPKIRLSDNVSKNEFKDQTESQVNLELAEEKKQYFHLNNSGSSMKFNQASDLGYKKSIIGSAINKMQAFKANKNQKDNQNDFTPSSFSRSEKSIIGRALNKMQAFKANKNPKDNKNDFIPSPFSYNKKSIIGSALNKMQAFKVKQRLKDSNRDG